MNLPWWKLTIQLEEPFTCAAKPAVSNVIETTEYIPATNLRGALASALQRAQRSGELDRWFGFDGPLFSNGWPAVDAPSLIPLPLCFMRDKYDRGDFDGDFGVYNVLCVAAGSLPEDTAGHRHQWTRLSRRWLKVDAAGAILRSAEVDTATSMHAGLYYARQSVCQSALFARAKLPPGSNFTAWIYDLKGIITNPPATVFLGKRRTAGNGAARLSWEPCSAWPWDSRANIAQPMIQLLSPAILPNVETTGYGRGITAGDLKTVFGDSVAILAAASAAGTTGGWSSSWGLPRERALTVAAGSAWKLDTPISPTASLAFIGLRNNEGFGWVAIDPPWLRQGAEAVYGHERPIAEAPSEAPKPWPGTSGLATADLEDIQKRARDAAKKLKNDRARLAFLASMAARCKDVQDWQLQFQRATVNPRWENIKTELSKLETGESLPKLRFALETLAGLTEKKRQ